MLERQKPSPRGIKNLRLIRYPWVLPGLRFFDPQDPPYPTTSNLIYSNSIDFLQEAKLLVIPSKFMSENHHLAYCDLSKWPVGMVAETAFPGFLWSEYSCVWWRMGPENESYWQKRRKKQAGLFLSVSLVTSPHFFLLLPILLFPTPLLFTLLLLFGP